MVKKRLQTVALYAWGFAFVVVPMLVELIREGRKS